MNTPIITNFETFEDFRDHVNMVRKKNKNNWYVIIGTVMGREFQIKAYKTWLQIFKLDGINYGGTMDQTVKAFNTELALPFGGAK